MIITPAQTCGPLFGFAMTPPGVVQAVPEDHPEAIVVEGRILDGSGEDIGYGGFVELWSTEQTVRVRSLAGRYRAVLRKPSAVQRPDGHTLAPHLDVRLVMRGLALPLVTKIYFPDEEASNAADPVLRVVPAGLRPYLVAQRGSSARHFVHDIRLQGNDESVFFSIDEPGV